MSKLKLLFLTIVILAVCAISAYSQIAEVFEQKYAAWVAHRIQVFASWTGPSGEYPYKEIFEHETYQAILDLGLPAIPYIVQKTYKDNRIGGAIGRITKFNFHFENVGTGPTRITIVEEFPEVAGKRLPSISYFWQRWWDEYEVKTPEWFGARYAKWKEAKEAGNESEAEAIFSKIKDIGVPALPYIMEKVKEGDYDLLPAIEYLTDGKAPTKAQVTEGEAPEEEITPEKTAQDVLDWWEVNKDTYTIPLQ